jgi:hypothetical protein
MGKRQEKDTMFTGSFVNLVAGTSRYPAPEIGMGATILMYTDRHAATIVEVRHNMVFVRQDRATLKGSTMSESQEYHYEPNPEAALRCFTLRRNGAWVEQGTEMKSGTRLAIGHREEYSDPSF